MKNKKKASEAETVQASPKFWSKVKNWALQENLVPFVLSSNCCNSVISLMDDPGFAQLVDMEAFNSKTRAPDLLIIHGKLNEDKLRIAKMVIGDLQGKKLVIGLGACLNEESQFVSEIEFDILLPACSINSETILGCLKKVLKEKVV